MVLADNAFKVKWDPTNLEIKTWSVEKALEPLILQVTTLVNSKGYSNRKKGCSKKAIVLVATVDEAVRMFVSKGHFIARQNPDAYDEIMKALDEVKLSGEVMSENSRIFADDPCNTAKRSAMVLSARTLLSAVTRLLIVADMVDMYNLMKRLELVQKSLNDVCESATQHDFMEKFNLLCNNIHDLNQKLGERQKDVKDANTRDLIATARATLKKNKDMLYTTTKFSESLSVLGRLFLYDRKYRIAMTRETRDQKINAYLRHPELNAAKENREYVLAEMCKALELIESITRNMNNNNGTETMTKNGKGTLTHNGGSGKQQTPSINELTEKFIDAKFTENGDKNSFIPPSIDGMDLAQIIENFQRDISGQKDQANVNNSSLVGQEDRIKLEKALDNILKCAMGIATSNCTREETRDRILESCERVKKALTELITACLSESNYGADGSENPAIVNLDRKTQELKRQLKRAVVDHVSDSFLETGVPLLILAESAKNGDNTSMDAAGGLEKAIEMFKDHAIKLIQVAELACSLSTQVEGVRLVRLASRELKHLYPQVINAARILAMRPSSRPAQENFSAFQTAWHTQVRILTEAVDDITTIHDFLAVSESHILEDMDGCIKAFRIPNLDAVDRFAGAIRGRTLRVCDVVNGELEAHLGLLNNNNGIGSLERTANTVIPHIRAIQTLVATLKEKLIPFFSDRVRDALSTIKECGGGPEFLEHPSYPERDNEFVEANRLLFDGIRDVREALILAPFIVGPEDEEDWTAAEDCSYTMEEDANSILGDDQNNWQGSVKSDSQNGKNNNNNGPFDESLVSRDYAMVGGQRSQHLLSNSANANNQAAINENDRAIMRQLPQEAKAKIQREILSFREQKATFDREVSKWEDAGNDIVVIAKRMCIIMMEMTDFTRGRGPLKSTMDVISAAQKISEIGKGLDKLARSIADTCPESSTKKDLLAYLQRLDLYCQQLAITSKVKADVTNVGGEIVVSGLDSVTSLITAAKNLMNTVVLIVKSSYVASTKYNRYRVKNTNQPAPPVVVSWKMKPPQKKPLVRIEKENEKNGCNRSIIRRASNKRKEAPIKALNEFHQNF